MVGSGCSVITNTNFEDCHMLMCVEENVEQGLTMFDGSETYNGRWVVKFQEDGEREEGVEGEN